LSERTLLVTGGDGFIGRRILSHFRRDPIEIVLLVQPKFLDETIQLVNRWERTPSNEAEYQVVPGDITESGLGLSSDEIPPLKETVTGLIHLAAAYDLSIDRETGQAINVEGTRNVLNFARECEQLSTLGYMSTTAISGDYENVYREEDYDVNQSFNNYYEETKFEAEGLVREAMEDLPIIIYRPTTVVGDSETGEIDKIDGPYYLIQTIDRNFHLVIPETGNSKFHIEPVDFVAEAFYTIFETPDATGACYHLADSNPPTYREFIDKVCDYWNKVHPLLELSPDLMEPMFSLPGTERIFGLPAEAFVYSYLNRQYSTEQADEILDGTGVQCPPVEDYLPVVLDFYKNHLKQGDIRTTRW
jgi:thioester reductase-like protein